MLYLSRFVFPDWDDDYQYRLDLKRTCYNSIYPFFVLSERGLTELKFAPVTVLYGGNGSGKTTALNVIAEALSLSRNAPYNRSDFFGDYVGLCSFSLSATIPEQSAIVTSDDVFEYMLNVRSLSDDIDRERQELLGEWVRRKYGHMQMRSLDDYDVLKDTLDARRKTQSAYVRSRIPKNPREQSNGESAFFYFTSRLQEPGLYLLDEPENSLSTVRQIGLRDFLENAARFFGCQFVIATHSPFLLSMRGAKVYDLDAAPAAVKHWTQLPDIRAAHEFFEAHRDEFRSPDKK